MFHGENLPSSPNDGVSYGAQNGFSEITPLEEIPPLPGIPSRELKKGGIIFDIEWNADSLVLLRKGRAYSYGEGPEGTIFGEMITAPSFLGFEFIEEMDYYSKKAVAFDATVVQYIKRNQYTRLVQEDARFRAQLLNSLVERTRKKQDFYLIRSRGSRAATAYALLDVAHGQNTCQISQSVLASLTGFDRMSVNHVMTQLRSRGIVKYGKEGGTTPGIELLDSLSLGFIATTGRMPKRDTIRIRPRI